MLPRSLVALAILLSTTTLGLELPKTRKTLAFGFKKPSAEFVTHPIPTVAKRDCNHDPIEVARDFIESLVPRSDEFEFRIRKDSYTDEATGVTHVFAKQLYRGLVVANGDINVNIYKGAVISHGNEFYHPELDKRDQVPLSTEELPEASSEDSGVLDDPLTAVLRLMRVITPSDDTASIIDSDFDALLSRLDVHPEASVGEPDVMAHSQFTITGVPDAIGDVKTGLVYAQTARGLELAWKFHVEMQDNFYEATVSAADSSLILNIVDWVSDSPLPLYLPMDIDSLPPALSHEELKKKPSNPADPEVDPSYNVFPWGINDPDDGNRTINSHSASADKLASPYGWHSVPATHLPYGYDPTEFAPIPGKTDIVNLTTTFGNNVMAQENWEGRNEYLNNYRPDAGKEMKFEYKYDPKNMNDTEGRMKEAKKHINATVTQLFYTTNLFHDLLYRYGFNEVSGNFQLYNFGRGGKEKDAVIANAQDGSGFNNANFMTPPDGTNGRMRMYLWNTASPYRDGDFEAGIVIHELAHGLSTRLTGGPADSSCLAFGESGGMGEGWGDFLATTIRSTSNYSDYPMGSWAANQVRGIRNYPYSLNNTINPETYKSVDQYFGVHPIGEVWAQMLWVVEQKLIKAHGFVDSLFPPAPLENGTIPEGDFYRASSVASGPLIPKHGNSLMVQLVVNGMKLQPCRPSFFDARDAIIQADQILTQGENFCDLWEGFASRGLGVDAKVVGKTPWGGGIRTNGFSIPLKCQVGKPE